MAARDDDRGYDLVYDERDARPEGKQYRAVHFVGTVKTRGSSKSNTYIFEEAREGISYTPHLSLTCQARSSTPSSNGHQGRLEQGKWAPATGRLLAFLARR